MGFPIEGSDSLLQQPFGVVTHPRLILAFPATLWVVQA